MPFYIFLNPETGEEKDVLQKMDENHVYIDENGLEWTRVFTPTNFSMDGKINPMSKEEFISKTSNKNYTLGEIQDTARELSEKRAGQHGHDPIQKAWFKNYSAKRKGKVHPSDPSRKTSFEV